MINQPLFLAAKEAYSQQKTKNELIAEQQRIEAEAEAEAENKAQTAKTIEWFKTKFGIDVTGMADGRIVHINDRTKMFRPKFEHNNWKVEKSCANYDISDEDHQPAFYTWADRLADIGEFFEKEETHDICGRCTYLQNNPEPAERQPTVEEKLVSVLRDFISQQGYQGEF